MTSSFVPLRRSAALSVAVTLFTATITSAQSVDASPPPAKTTLLSPAAFSRLVHPPQTEVVPAVVAPGAPRPSLIRQVAAATVRASRATPTKAPQGSWVSRHPGLTWTFIIVGAIFGLALISSAWDE
jgi:hypothetical protein